MYPDGQTPSSIATTLPRQSVPTPAGQTNWQSSTVKPILTNEKYKGGALLQKTITVGFLGKARNCCLSEDAEYMPVPLGKLRLRKRPRQ